MQRSQFEEQERKLAAERSIKYRGTASVKIDVLDFSAVQPKDPDEQNITRLKGLFREANACDRWNISNHVPAIIDQRDLTIALADSGVSAERLLAGPHDGYPELDFPIGYRLQCLHGRHRVLASAEAFPREVRRWSVDFYLTDLNDDLKTTLLEEYSSERAPDDGEIYRKIREYQGYHGQGNVYFEKRWWARLYAISRNKWENLKQILRHPGFRTAFDVQMIVPGLGGGMRLSTSHKMFAMRCHEENLRYLDYIREFWFTIFRGDLQAMQKVDRPTIKAMELTAPGAFREDRQTLLRKLQQGRIFGAFDEKERRAIWEVVLLISSDRLIPSLFSFFEDVNYLQGPAACMRRLLELSHGDTLSSALERCFSDVNQSADSCVVQISESAFRYIQGDRSVRKDLGRRQIWMSAMRNYLDVPVVSKRGSDSLLAKPRSDLSEHALGELATLANRLGYDSEQIQGFMEQPTDRQIARNVLLEARKPDRYKYEAIAFEQYVDQIVGFFSTAQEISDQATNAPVQNGDLDAPPKRYGIPRLQDHRRDKSFLFADHLHRTDLGREEMTSFFVRRSVYLNFFGTRSYSEMEDGSDSASASFNENRMNRSHAREADLERMRQAEMESAQQVERERARQAELDRQAELERVQQAELEKQSELERARQAELDRQAELERARQAELDRQAELERARQAELDRETELESARLAELERQSELVTETDTQTNSDSLAGEISPRWKESQRPRKLMEVNAPSPLQEIKSTIRDDSDRRITRLELENVRDLVARNVEEPSSELSTNTNMATDLVLEGASSTSLHVTRRRAEKAWAYDEHAKEVVVTFRIIERGSERVVQRVAVDPADPAEVRRIAIKYMRKRIAILDTNFRRLNPNTCFEDVVADGSCTILLIPEAEVDDELLDGFNTQQTHVMFRESESQRSPNPSGKRVAR